MDLSAGSVDSGPSPTPTIGITIEGSQIPIPTRTRTVQNTLQAPIQIVLEEATCNWTANLPPIGLFNPAKEKARLTTSPLMLLGAGHSLTQWKIQVSHDFWFQSHKRTVAIYLWRDSPWLYPLGTKFNPDPVYVHYVIEILDKDGNVFLSRENGVRNFVAGDCFGWRNFVEYSENVRSLITECGDKLHIRAKIQLFETPNPNPGDIDISNNGVIVYQAKKAVLIEKSNKFRTLIMSEDGNDMTNVLLYCGVKEALQELLDFMHNGECCLLNEKPSDSLEHNSKIFFLMWSFNEYATDYEVEDAKAACCKKMFDYVPIAKFVQVSTSVRIFNFERKQEHYKTYNALKRYFRNNLDAIKAQQPFVAICKQHPEFYLELLLGPEKDEA